MARQSAPVRKRRPRAKRAAPDVCEPDVAATESIEIESAAEPVASVAEQDAAPAEPIVAVQEPVLASAEPVSAVQEPVMLAAEPVVAVPEPVEPAPEPVMAAQDPAMPEDKPLTLVREPEMPREEPVLSVDEPAMPVPVRIRTPAECKARLDRITRQWCNLAERRLQHYTELYRSGRWRRYYTEERFVVVMNEVAKSVANWRALIDRMSPAAAGNDDLRLSA